MHPKNLLTKCELNKSYKLLKIRLYNKNSQTTNSTMEFESMASSFESVIFLISCQTEENFYPIPNL